MRNAAANFDDLDFEGPPRKKASGRGASSKPSKRKKKGKGRFRFDVDMQRVARYAAIGMSVTVAVGIMVNALLMQKGRHPAPLFGERAATSETDGKQAAAKTEVPKAKPQTEVAAAVPTPPVQAPSPVKRSDAAPASADAIGRFLHDGSVPVDRSEPKTVLEAQRALVKLGFALKPTGTFGPQTKKAVERFEKEHHLPVKGELSRKVVKLLAAESGLKIER